MSGFAEPLLQCRELIKHDKSITESSRSVSRQGAARGGCTAPVPSAEPLSPGARYRGPALPSCPSRARPFENTAGTSKRLSARVLWAETGGIRDSASGTRGKSRWREGLQRLRQSPALRARAEGGTLRAAGRGHGQEQPGITWPPGAEKSSTPRRSDASRCR